MFGQSCEDAQINDQCTLYNKALSWMIFVETGCSTHWFSVGSGPVLYGAA